MTNLDSTLESRDITLPAKVHLVRAMVFPVVTYGCESWTITKSECRRIDAFEPGCWSRRLRVTWTARRSNQSILKEISPEYSLEGLMLKLKLQYFGHLMQRADSFEKTLVLGKIESGRRRGQQRMRWLDGIDGHESEQTLGVGHGHGSMGCCSPWGCWVKHNWATELNYLTESSDMAPQCLSTNMVLEFFFVIWHSVNCFTYICLILIVSLQAKFSIEPHFMYEEAEPNTILGINGRAWWWMEVPILQLEQPWQDLKNGHKAPWASSSMIFPIPIHEFHGYPGFKLLTWLPVLYDSWWDKAFPWPIHNAQQNLWEAHRLVLY